MLMKCLEEDYQINVITSFHIFTYLIYVYPHKMNEKHQNSHILYLTGLWIILKKFFFHFDIFF